MTQCVDAAPTMGAPERKRENRPVAFWLLTFAAAIIPVGAVVCDASLTPDQRIQAYLQSGMFPWTAIAAASTLTAGWSLRFADEATMLAQLELLMLFRVIGEAFVSVSGIRFPGPSLSSWVIWYSWGWY